MAKGKTQRKMSSPRPYTLPKKKEKTIGVNEHMDENDKIKQMLLPQNSKGGFKKLSNIKRK